MFSDSKKDRQNAELISSQNIISNGTKIVGDLISEGDLRIDGTIDAHFEGKFSGKLNLSGTLTLKSSAHVEGEVVLGKLEVEPGATFNVTCTMKGAVKEIHSKNERKEPSRPGQETA